MGIPVTRYTYKQTCDRWHGWHPAQKASHQVAAGSLAQRVIRFFLQTHGVRRRVNCPTSLIKLAGYLAFGRRNQEQTALQFECLKGKEKQDDLIEIRYISGGEMNECEEVFISALPGNSEI